MSTTKDATYISGPQVKLRELPETVHKPKKAFSEAELVESFCKASPTLALIMQQRKDP